jgi:hypothetical protein
MTIQALRAPRRLALAAGLAVAAMVGGTVASALPATPSGQWATGSVRLSSNSATGSIAITGTSGPNSLKRVLRTKVVVPSGRVADVQTSFSAMLQPNAMDNEFAYCNGYFTLDSQTNLDTSFKPGDLVQLLGGGGDELPNAVGVAMVGFKRNIGPGTHYVNVMIQSAYTGCTLSGRALNVVINIR